MTNDSEDSGDIPARCFDSYDEWLASLTPAQLERAQYVADQLGFKDTKAFWWNCYRAPTQFGILLL